MSRSRSLKLPSGIEAKNLISATGATLAIWLLVARAVEEYLGNEFRVTILHVFAKCPGLPYGAYSGGPDYIDISIDIGLSVVAFVLIYLTIRDIRRKRRGASLEDGEESENPEEEQDEL